MKILISILLCVAVTSSYAQQDIPSQKIKSAQEMRQREAELTVRKNKILSSFFRKGVALEQFGHETKQPISPGFNIAPDVQTDHSISSIPPQGIIIESAGTYTLSDITWHPQNTAAITIDADDVVLDFQGAYLTIKGADSTKKYVGVQVFPFHKNVTIKNGIINGGTYFGVYAWLDSNITVDGMYVSGMGYSDTANDITPCGVVLSGVTNFSVKNCKINNMDVTSSSCAGIQLFASDAGEVSNCTVNNLVNHDGSVQGFSYELSSNVATANCHSSNLHSFNKGIVSTMGHTAIGFCPVFGNGLTYDNCSATNITGCCDDAHGMSVFLDSAVTINNFTAKHIIDGVSPYNTGAKATGLEVYGYDVAVTNSTVDSIIAIVPQDLQSTGFSAWGNHISFSNCTAKNVQVLNAQLAPDTTKGFGTGFGWAPDPRTEFDTATANNVLYANCKAENCQLGFDTWYLINPIWTKDTAQHCLIPVLVAPNAQRTLSMNKCSESPDGQYMKVTITNKSNIYTIPKGIQVITE